MRTVHTDIYYTSMQHLMNVFDKKSRKMGFNSSDAGEFKTWKKNVREKLCEIIGINRMEKCEPCVSLLESEMLPGYRRDKLIIQTEPDVWMPFYVLTPYDYKTGERRPCIIAPHGHESAGKYSPSGRVDIPALRDTIEKHNYDYGVKFVLQGYIVFCPDARAFGERREWTGQDDDEKSFLESTCIQLNHMAICLGQSVTGMWTWDLMRLIDYIGTREDCDSNRICCAGLSGGGLQTLWLAALDERVKCAVVSGYFYGYKDSLLELSSNCGCNYVPHLWEYVDMGDIGALIAPRHLLIESGSRDNLNGERGLVNVTEQLEITCRAYKLFGADSNLFHHVFDGEHKWDGEKTYTFVAGALKR